MSRGCFIAVVGPSGAGKDSLIRGAVQVRPDLILARRAITRPRAPESEDFESLADAVFTTRKNAGNFVLDWQAHGLRYGIPGGVELDLAAGRSVVANLSRGVIDAARTRFDPFQVIVVTAPILVLAERLSLRGRETAEEIAERLQRAEHAAPQGPDVHVVENSGTIEEGVSSFLAVLPQPVSG